MTARSQEQLDATVDAITAGGGEAIGVAGDVSAPGDVDRVVDTVGSAFGDVTALVNAAGIWAANPGPIWTSDVDEWWRVVEVNLRGPMLYARAVLPAMLQRDEGCIVNINSVAGVDARSAKLGSSSYGVSKAALFRLTHVLGAELAGTGIRVFDLTPGLVRTSLTEVEQFAHVPAEGWTDVARPVAATVAMIEGRLDALRGRCVDANDDLDSLVAHANTICERDARVLALRLFGDSDPLQTDYLQTGYRATQ